jgi:Lipase (class 3)
MALVRIRSARSARPSAFLRHRGERRRSPDPRQPAARVHQRLPLAGHPTLRQPMAIVAPRRRRHFRHRHPRHGVPGREHRGGRAGADDQGHRHIEGRRIQSSLFVRARSARRRAPRVRGGDAAGCGAACHRHSRCHASDQIGANAQVFVTGHSQGAAMATLLRSYLQYSPNAPQGVSYNTYIYAQRKPGNDHYAADFANRFSNPSLGFRVTNSLDWVPQVPFTLGFLGDVNKPNPLSVLSKPEFMIKIGSALRLKAIEQLVDDLRSPDRRPRNEARTPGPAGTRDRESRPRRCNRGDRHAFDVFFQTTSMPARTSR